MKYIVSVSGGKDSTATLLYMINQVGKDKVVPVFMDTKWEADETYEYLDYLEEKLGISLVRIESMGMFELSKMKKIIPNRQYRFCTEWLKIRPFEEWLKENFVDKGIDFLIAEGVRREESSSRADTPNFLVKKSLIKPVFDKPTLYPIVHWTTEEVFKYIEDNGLKKNPLYDKGFRRVGCMPCIFASKYELMYLPKKYRARLERLEKEISEFLGRDAFMFRPQAQKYLDEPLLFTYEDLFENQDKGANNES